MDKLKQIKKPVAYSLPKGVADNEIIVLPERINDDGISLYVHSSMEIYKELREEEGVQVQYFGDKRKWIDRLGAGDELIISLIFAVPLGVLSSAIWYAIQRFVIERIGSKNLRVKLTIANQDAKGTSWKWYEFEGSPKEVKELADRMIDEQEKTPKL